VGLLSELTHPLNSRSDVDVVREVVMDIWLIVRGAEAIREQQAEVDGSERCAALVGRKCASAMCSLGRQEVRECDVQP